jgi:hypothetical protein
MREADMQSRPRIKREWLGSDFGGDVEAAGGVGHAGGEGDGFEQAGGDEAGGVAVEVDDRGCGLWAGDAVLVA